MTQNFNVLIVDDHPIIIEGYQIIMNQLTEKYDYLNFKVSSAHSCDSANKLIERYSEFETIDLVLLDISLPPSKNGEIISGEGIGLKLRSLFRDVKIIVLTSITENHRLLNILKSINPEGFLIKTEMTSITLSEAIMSVISDAPFYSKSLLKLLRQHISNDINLDTTYRKLLYHLSLGTKTKDLPDLVNLSLAAVERRKRKLNEFFNIEGKSDKELLKAARAKGFL